MMIMTMTDGCHILVMMTILTGQYDTVLRNGAGEGWRCIRTMHVSHRIGSHTNEKKQLLLYRHLLP